MTFSEMLNVFSGAVVISFTFASGKMTYGSFPSELSVICLIVFCKMHAIMHVSGEHLMTFH